MFLFAKDLHMVIIITITLSCFKVGSYREHCTAVTSV